MTGHTVLVNGSYVVIKFHSDEEFQHQGFLLVFTAVQIGNRTTTQQPENACGQVVNNTLKSPGYPDNYQNGTECFYVIPILQDTRLNIIFKDFDVEPEPNCE
ncbi:CUB and peptidase domain-containing protein 1-like [Orbicella faveolata]|nr:CUB and peptidase domain-containing protein 1-like [Orbicella faveolata]